MIFKKAKDCDECEYKGKDEFCILDKKIDCMIRTTSIPTLCPLKKKETMFLIRTDQFCYECNTLASVKKKIEEKLDNEKTAPDGTVSEENNSAKNETDNSNNE